MSALQPSSDAGRRYASLVEARRLALRLAGGAEASGADESERVSAVYEEAPPIVQRRFDTLAAEVSAWAAAGVDALAAASDPDCPPQAAAARLAEALDEAVEDLGKLLRL